MKRLFAIILDAILGSAVTSMILLIIVPELTGLSVAPLLVIPATIAWIAAATFGGASIGQLFVSSKTERPLPNGLRSHMGWIAFCSSIVAGWIVTDISPIEFFSGEGLKGAGRIFGALFTPEFDVLGAALDAMVVTVFTALMATIVAVPMSFVLSFAAARNVMTGGTHERVFYVLLRALLNIMRSMEPIIWAIIFSVWVGIGPFAGMLALVVHTIASLTKQYSEQIEDVNHGPLEAVSATGAKRLQVLWFAIVPQCVIPFLSFTIYRWDINVRMATIIGFVGGGGIGTLLTQYQGLAKYNEVGTLVILITLVVWMLDVISARVREALR
ncbi:MAG: phosphonate ABC transporter, permease protein PhnE [Candidatus Kapabacteria bacterium]|nr:phosphonate ABC transporter, permease protein PhnE [Candidatus Kapabacteria bacterium]